MKYHYIFYILLFFSIFAKAQEKKVDHKNQQWLAYYNQLELSKNWSINSDFQYRWEVFFSHHTQYLVRSQATYKIADALETGAGLGISGSYEDESLSKMEYRPFQEIQLKSALLTLALDHRLRVEERFFEDRITNDNSFNMRFRYRLQLTIPVFKISSNPDKTLDLIMADEIFLNAGHSITYDVFDQNRILLSASAPLNKNVDISLTYNNQFAAKNSPASYTRTHIFWLSIKHKIDISKNTSP